MIPGEVVEVDVADRPFRGEVVDGNVWGDMFGRPLCYVVVTEAMTLRPVTTISGNGCREAVWRPVPAKLEVGRLKRPLLAKVPA